MTRQDQELETRLRHTLASRATHAFPDQTDLWPRLYQRLPEPSAIRSGPRSQSFRWRQAVLPFAACLVLLIGTAAIAAAASPSFRHLLQTRLTGGPARQSSGGYTQEGVPSLHPLPAFPLYYPSALPHNLRQIHGIARLNSRNGRDVFAAGGNCPRPPAPCPAMLTGVFIPPHPSAGFPSLVIPFARTTTDVVWFGVADFPPGAGFVQIAEWDAAGSPLKTLTPSMVPRLHPGERETLLTLRKGKTTIAIDTDLGRSVAQSAAGSLLPFHNVRAQQGRQ